VTGVKRISATRQLMALIGVVVVLAGGLFVLSTRDSDAAESCQGLDTALQNNVNFIAGQQQSPDAQSAARIANRQAVVDLIQQRRTAAGCTANVQAGGNAANKQGSGENCVGLDTALRNNLNFIAGQQKSPDAQSKARIANRQAVVDQIQQRRAAAGCTGGGKADGDKGNANGNNGNANGNKGVGNGKGNNGNGNGNGGSNNADPGTGDVVCPGSTVTLSGEGGAAGAASNQFPIGTRLKVTNLDNKKSTTVAVTSVSGSCILLNNAAFEQVREPGKFLIRRAVIEKVG
jgi:hypothetical protein